MNKNDFLSQLETSLQKLPSTEREEIIQDFEEHFAIGMTEGKTEEEIARSLGSPKQIAKEMIASYHVEKAEAKITTGNIIRAVIAAVSLGFFNLVFILGPFIALVAIIFSGWVVGGSFILSPLLVLIDTILFPMSFVFFDLFLSIFLCGLGIFVAIGMYYVTKLFMKLFVKYLKFNTNLVKGGFESE